MPTLLVCIFSWISLIRGLDYLGDDEHYHIYQSRYELDAESEALLISISRQDYIIFVLDNLSYRSQLFSSKLNSTRQLLQQAFPSIAFETFDITQAEKALSFASFTEAPCVCISRLAIYKCLCSDEVPDMDPATIGRFVLQFYCDPQFTIDKYPKDLNFKKQGSAKIVAFYDQETRGGMLATGLKFLQCKYDKMIELVQISTRAGLSEVLKIAGLTLKERDQVFFIRHYDQGGLVYPGSNFGYYLEKTVVDLMFPPSYILNMAAWEMYVKGSFRRMLIYFYENEDDRTRRDLQLLTEDGLYKHFKTKYEIFIAPTLGDYYFNKNRAEELRVPYLPMLMLLDAEEGEERWFAYPYGELTVSKILTFLAEYEHDEIPRHFKTSPPQPITLMQDTIDSAVRGETGNKPRNNPDKVTVHELVGVEFRDKVFTKFGKLVFVLLYGFGTKTTEMNFEEAIQPLRHLPNSSFYKFDMEKEELPYYHLERLAGSVLVATPFNDSVEIISGTGVITTKSLLLALKRFLPQ